MKKIFLMMALLMVQTIKSDNESQVDFLDQNYVIEQPNTDVKIGFAKTGLWSKVRTLQEQLQGFATEENLAVAGLCLVFGFGMWWQYKGDRDMYKRLIRSYQYLDEELSK